MGRLTDLFAGRSVTALTERARRRLAAGKLDEAERIVERGLEMYPGSNTLGDLHLTIRRAQAHKTLRRLEVRIDARQDPLAYEELIKLYLSLELPDEAQRKAREFVEAHPNRDTPHQLIGEIHLDAFFEDLQARHGHAAHDHLVKAATLNAQSLQPRLLLAELYFCIDARRSLSVIAEGVTQMAPETPEIEAAVAVMQQVADPQADEMMDGLFERIEVSGTLVRDPVDWPLRRRRGSNTSSLEDEAEPMAEELVEQGAVEEIVLLRRDGSVITHQQEGGMGPTHQEAPFVNLVRTVTSSVFAQAGEFDMGKFKRFTIRGAFGNVVVGRVGAVMVGARGATTTEALRLWEQVTQNLERAASGKKAPSQAKAEESAA